MIFRVDVRSHKGTIQIVNTFHVRSGDDDVWETPDPDEPGNVADAVNGVIQSTYRGMLTDTWTLDGFFVSSVPDPAVEGDVVYAGEHDLALAGLREPADEDLPPTLCARITWTTDASGKSFRGRTFAPPAEYRQSFLADQWSTEDPYWAALLAFRDDVVDVSSGTGFDQSGDGGNLKFGVYSLRRRIALQTPFFSVIRAGIVRPDPSLMHSRAR